jgi:chitin disaccharide deacetylase
MSRRLIMKADDYGRTPGVSMGIRSAYLNGIVTSTSALMTRPWIVSDLALAKAECPQLEIGVHLILTTGPSLLPPDRIPTLTAGTPGFRGLLPLTEDLEQIVLDEAMDEWRAQIELFVSLTSKAPGHLDSHHHFSYFREDLFEGMAALAAQYDCPVRMQVAPPGCSIGGIPEHLQPAMVHCIPRLIETYRLRSPDYFYDGWYDENATLPELTRVISALPAGSTTEIMCHPGCADAVLLDAVEGSIYNHERECELKILTDPALKAFLIEQEIELINFNQL